MAVLIFAHVKNSWNRDGRLRSDEPQCRGSLEVLSRQTLRVTIGFIGFMALVTTPLPKK